MAGFIRDSLTAGRNPDSSPKIRHAISAPVKTMKLNENDKGTLFIKSKLSVNEFPKTPTII